MSIQLGGVAIITNNNNDKLFPIDTTLNDIVHDKHNKWNQIDTNTNNNNNDCNDQNDDYDDNKLFDIDNMTPIPLYFYSL